VALDLREDLAHDLAGPAADRDEAKVAPRAGDVVLVHVAVAAVEVEAAVRDLVRELARDELGHGDLADALDLAVDEVTREVREAGRRGGGGRPGAPPAIRRSGGATTGT